MKIVLATRNRKKVEEIRRVMEGKGISFLSLDDFPECPEVVEDRDTFEGNAGKKAEAVAAFCGLPALADDSGLAVDALGGAPGVYSARYAGPDATDQENFNKVLEGLAGVVGEKRSARFECVLAFAAPGEETRYHAGRVEGVIATIPQGENGFGYDPVFKPEGGERTFAQMAAHEKDAMSHRGRALALFADSF